MATKRPKRRFNLFDEEFGDTPEVPVARSKGETEDSVSRRIRIRQAIVDLPFESKIEFLKSESTDFSDFDDLKNTFFGNPSVRDKSHLSSKIEIQEAASATLYAETSKMQSSDRTILSPSVRTKADELLQADVMGAPTLDSSNCLNPTITPAEKNDPAQNDGFLRTNVKQTPNSNIGQTSDKPRTNLGPSVPVNKAKEFAGNDEHGRNLGQTSDISRTNLGHDVSTHEVCVTAVHSSPMSSLSILGQTSDNYRTNLGQHGPIAEVDLNIALSGNSGAGINLVQTWDNPKTTPRTNVGHLSDKARTNERAEPRTKCEFSDKPRSEPRTRSASNLGQFSDKPRTVSVLQALSGLQQNIAQLMYELCCEKGGRITGPISVDFLMSNLGSTRLSIQKTIQRLENKEILNRIESKSGRGGWTVYEIPNAMWNEFRQTENILKLRTNLGQTSDIPKTQPRTETRTTGASKLVSDLNKDLLTRDEKPSLEVELTAVANLGITQKHIQDIRNQRIQVSSYDLQTFVNRFAVYADDEKNVRGVKSFPALFISMVQSLGKGADPLEGIQTLEEQLIEKLLKEKKAAAQRRQEIELELEKFEFETWAETLSETKRLELVPETNIVRKGTHAHAVLLREYFKTNVWPMQKAEMLRSLKS